MLWLVLAAAAGARGSTAACCTPGPVRAACFGYDAADATVALQRALACERAAPLLVDALVWRLNASVAIPRCAGAGGGAAICPRRQCGCAGVVGIAVT